MLARRGASLLLSASRSRSVVRPSIRYFSWNPLHWINKPPLSHPIFTQNPSAQATWQSILSGSTISGGPSVDPQLLPLILAIIQHSDDEDDSPPTNSKLFRTQSQQNKGLGLIATQDIPAGTVLISETPLAVWPQSLDAASAQSLFSAMSSSSQRTFLALSNSKPANSQLDDILAIRATNAFAVEIPEIETENNLSKHRKLSFIFPTIARINHSCTPNSDLSMNWKSLKMSVYATAAISEGEEISIEYLPGLLQKTRAQRSAELNYTFGFDCKCKACMVPEEQGRESDERRRNINGIVKELSKGSLSRPEMLKRLEKLHGLIQAEGFKAMPEFDEPQVNKAYVIYATLQRQKSSSQP